MVIFVCGWEDIMRKPRKKSPNYMYHIRVRGMKEVLLFRDKEDKLKYLLLLKKYCKKFDCKIITYILMDTHGHIHIDPRGYDISKLMHVVNLCYAQYYNKKYDRGGPVFRGRFESNPVCNNTYSIALSAYIHNNAKDLPEFRGKEEYFYFSSYGIYAGIRENTDELVDTSYILSLMLEDSPDKAREKYLNLVKKRKYDNSILNIIECLASGNMQIADETIFKE
jgi:REP element-mobilizing transposase RayT